MSAVDFAVSAPGATTFAVPVMPLPEVAAPHRAASQWTYEEAFKRNRGLISAEEQEKLRNCRVAIAGMGGVGASHLVTLARLGVGRFRIADPDVFDIPNFNRQCGAVLPSLGANKANVMAQMVRDINPYADVDVLEGRVGEANVDEFLADCNVFIDGLDFFAICARRLVFRRARKRGIWGITAGPIGLSAAWLLFDPQGVEFDRYFDFTDGQCPVDQLIAFAVGLTPTSTHRGYTDLSGVNIQDGVGPSASPACQLASGVAATEAVKIILGRGSIRAAPYYAQFDLYRNRFNSGRLRFGNRNPRQLIKRKLLKQYLRKKGVI